MMIMDWRLTVLFILFYLSIISAFLATLAIVLVQSPRHDMRLCHDYFDYVAYWML